MVLLENGSDRQRGPPVVIVLWRHKIDVMGRGPVKDVLERHNQVGHVRPEHMRDVPESGNGRNRPGATRHDRHGPGATRHDPP